MRLELSSQVVFYASGNQEEETAHALFNYSLFVTLQVI